MKITKSLGMVCAFLCVWVVVTNGVVSCGGDQPKACASSRDCDQGFTCANKICLKRCVDDVECKSLNLTCKDGICGGIVKPDGGTPETPQGECQPGTIEECYSGPSGTKGVGECKAGKRTCSDEGKWGECKGEVTPTSESCDGKDNDCDSNVDNNCGTTCTEGQTRSCYTGAEGTQDVGPCKAGTETCGADGSWGQCEGQVLPVPENCGTKQDDNCDGKANEGCDCTPGESRDCKADNGCAGIQACAKKPGGGGSEWGKCLSTTPYDEKCDQLDNDCDGKVDNIKGTDDVLTRKCNNEPCKDEGVETCEKGQWRNCTGRKAEPETCNGKDDNCDGFIDNIEGKEDLLVKACVVKDPKTGQELKGLCKDGIMQCKNGKFDPATCTGAKPKQEQCNGFDDDCDGVDDLKETDNMCGDGNECIKDTLGTIRCVPK